jgi:hypothetical protein
VDANSRERQRIALSFLSDVRLHRLLGERRFSWIRTVPIGNFADPNFPAPTIAVGGVTPPQGLLAARHTAQARGEAGVTPGIAALDTHAQLDALERSVRRN